MSLSGGHHPSLFWVFYHSASTCIGLKHDFYFKTNAILPLNIEQGAVMKDICCMSYKCFIANGPDRRIDFWYMMVLIKFVLSLHCKMKWLLDRYKSREWWYTVFRSLLNVHFYNLHFLVQYNSLWRMKITREYRTKLKYEFNWTWTDHFHIIYFITWPQLCICYITYNLKIFLRSNWFNASQISCFERVSNHGFSFK